MLAKILKPTCLKTLVFLTFFIGLLCGPKAQTARFKTYDVTQGICHPFIYTINQDKNGFIWLGTGEGLCYYDGFEFKSPKMADSISADVVSTSFRDNLGNLWFGFNNGQIITWDGYHFRKVDLDIENASTITDFEQTSDGTLIVATLNNGVFRINLKGKSEALSQKLSQKLLTKILATDNRIFIGSQEGLAIYDISENGDINIEEELQIEELAYIKVQLIKFAPWQDSYFIGTEDEGLYLLKFRNDFYELIKIGAGTAMAHENIQDLITDDDNNLWICSYYSGLIKLNNIKPNGSYLSQEQYQKNKGFSSNFTKSIFQDREKNIWVGTYGNGLAMMTGQFFTFNSFEKLVSDNNILSVTTNDSLLWVGGDGFIIGKKIPDDGTVNYIDGKKGLPKDKITTLKYYNNVVWIGTMRSGIYQYDLKSDIIKPFFRADNSIGNSINYLLAGGDILYAASKDGIYVFDLANNKQYHYNTLNGLPHNDIEHLFLDNDNRLLFATRSNGIYEITEKGEVEEFFTVGQYELEFNSITQDSKGQLWVSTYGQGLFLLLPDSVINITQKQGLKSNYCYGVISGDSSYVWIGHRLGISRININDLNIKLFEATQGITMDINQNALNIHKAGLIFFGTTDGLVTYDIEKGAKGELAPKTNIMKVLISDVEYDFTEPIVLPYSAYKLRVEFVGLLYNDPEAVTYQYFLKGFDIDWSDETENRTAIYPRIEDGAYTFHLRAFNSAEVSEGEPVTFKIIVKLPVWKTWWFISLVILTVILIVIAIIKYRERKQKQIQEYLEQRLDERTREVVEQKEEIELKNRDITDSINYAQRIQSSILPPIKKLQQSFSGSFIFYQPRDIVSGDFYWFDRVSEDKFIIVCADSTGHGVPGAFMSMIGTTLLKDICISGKAGSPSEILQLLDEDLRNTLNQNVEAEQSNDGMDIIVCEIDINSSYLRYASAMRPMIVYKNAEQIYIKGSRNSVGGHYDKEEKNFKDEGIQLEKGDLIYMFSDGYPDQFGGPMGKKFKMVRLKNLLKDIYKKPMEEQYEYVKSTFTLWRENYEQVDDVLFMGIKI